MIPLVWLRVNGEHDGSGVSPGMYVLAAEVAAALREHEAADVAAALDELAASDPPPTSSGTMIA